MSRPSMQSRRSKVVRETSSPQRLSRRTSASRQSSRSQRSPQPVTRNSDNFSLNAYKRSPSDSLGKSTLNVAARRIEAETTYRPRGKRRSRNLMASVLLSGIRLIIMGVGVGAIAGTTLTFFDPNTLLNLPTQKSEPKTQSTNSSVLPAKEAPASSDSSELALSQELVPLKDKIAALTAKYPKLEAGAFFVDLDNGAYVNLQAASVFSAASTIKIPVLIAFFQDIDAGKIHLDEKLTMRKELIGGGSGDMQHQPPDKQFSALETATKMIVISDNTATNMLIDRLGGKDALNQRFKEWGLTATAINNLLPDLEGTNTTSPQDLANLLAKIDRGELVSLKSRDRILGIMEQTRTRTLLPQGLEKEALIAHKTGDIGSVLGDAGIIDMPSGKRYIGAILVKRPHNDYTARTLIQEISRTVYQHFKWYQPRPFTKSNSQTPET